MKTKFLVVALSIFVLGTACSKDKDSKGLCNEGFIKDFNKAYIAGKNLDLDSSHISQTQLQTFIQACDQFMANQKSGQVCKAHFNETGEDVQVNSTGVYEVCNKAKSRAQSSDSTSSSASASSSSKSTGHVQSFPQMPEMPKMPNFDDFGDDFDEDYGDE